ncbi:hypothetical protein CVT26_009131 [Gymnopilus dilepis]|uniref:Sec20 C-terminal domain-containing protein n=1 Tax=Gymnopilus dilepis TaxID=231916 RepID=A0A409YRH3_9AGAR|nr:hypothetical protein CVT26_009131 [Gymnopilus dilepis]
MPPIPSQFPEEVKSLISGIERRHNHISQVEIPELRKCTGPLAVQQSLAEEVRQDTILLSKQIEDLDLMVDDLRGEKNRKELKESVMSFRQKLDNLKAETRAALLASKKAIDQRARSNREELFASSVLSEKDKQPVNEKSRILLLPSEDALMQANADVTHALRRTIALMQTELERSVLSTQLLQDSTKTLLSASEQHDTLSSVMHASKQLVTALEKSDWLDRVLILLAFIFFLLVVAFILKQRILDRGLRIAFWWTRFIPSFSGDAELLWAMEKGPAEVVQSGSQSLSSVVVSVASSVAPVATVVLSSSISSVTSTAASEESQYLSPQYTEALEAESPLPTPSPSPSQSSTSDDEVESASPIPTPVPSIPLHDSEPLTQPHAADHDPAVHVEL